MWQYFAIPAILNAPQLLRGDVGNYLKNTTIQGGTNAAIGNIAPNFNMNPAPSYAPGFTPPVASNIPGNLIGPQSAQQGLLSGAGAYTGPTSMMQANLGSNLGAPLNTANKSMMQYNLARPTDVVKPLPENTFQFDAGLANAPVAQKYPDYSITKDKLGRSLDYTGGGAEVAEVAEVAEKPLYQKAFEKVKDYVAEKPLEATMLAAITGGSIYEGLKGPERQPPQPTLGPKLGGGSQVNVGTPLQVRRSTPRRGR